MFCQVQLWPKAYPPPTHCNSPARYLFFSYLVKQIYLPDSQSRSYADCILAWITISYEHKVFFDWVRWRRGQRCIPLHFVPSWANVHMQCKYFMEFSFKFQITNCCQLLYIYTPDFSKICTLLEIIFKYLQWMVTDNKALLFPHHALLLK